MAEEEPFPPSQTIYPDRPIFLDQSGSPLEIFVDPGAVTGRPKLVRNLRRLGANICIDVAQARLILVDSSTKPGRQFIRDWAQDTHKVVLEYGWARKCINAGMAFLEKDNWGGCVAIDDGLQSDSDELEVENALKTSKSPLPTPRPTPTEISHFPQDPPPQAVSPKLTSQVDKPVHGVYPPHASQESAANGVTQQQQSFHQPPPPPLSQPPPPQQSFYLQPSQLFPLQAPIPQNQTMSYPPPPMNFGGIAPMQQPFANNYDTQNLMTMLDVMKSQGVTPYSILNQMFLNSQQLPLLQNNQPLLHNNQFTPSFLNSQPIIDQPLRTPGPLSSDTSEIGITNPSLSSSKLASGSQSRVQLSPSEVSITSASTTPSPQPHSQNKGQEPGDGHRKRASSKRESFQSSRRSPSMPGDMPVRDFSDGQHRPPGKIFTSESGRPLSFFVQVDHSNRLSLVQKIKKNGGRIESDSLLADYAVLDPAKEKDFINLMDVTIAAGKTAVRAIFVHDCVEHDLWLNPNGYVIQEHTSTKTKRNRPFLTTPAKTKSVRKVKRETRSSTPHSGSGSLSPPNEKSRQQANSGRYRYSEEEKAYFMQYVKVLFQRDPLISYNSISKKMHKKMPHHSAKAWRQYMVKKDVSPELWRLQQEYTHAHQAPKNEGRDEFSPSKKPKLESTAKVFRSDVEQQDFEFICNFFATGGDLEGTDAQIWEELARQSPCRSAESWPEFYTKNIAEVNMELERRIGSDDKVLVRSDT